LTEDNTKITKGTKIFWGQVVPNHFFVPFVLDLLLRAATACFRGAFVSQHAADRVV
jgi:hypothetical protein